MSFLKSSISFTRFMIIDEVTDALIRSVPEKLKQFSMFDIDHTTEERSLGWTNFDDMLDTKWELSVPQKANFITFSFRIDTRRIAPSVYKKHFRLALRAEEKLLEESGKKFITRDRRKEISEQVKIRLMARILPVPAEFGVVWSLDANTVYFASTHSKAIEAFTENFTASFNLHLERMLPYSLAQKVLGDGCEEVLDALEDTTFSIG